jgi:hypothetical protein
MRQRGARLPESNTSPIQLEEYAHPDNAYSQFTRAEGRHSRFGNI